MKVLKAFGRVIFTILIAAILAAGVLCLLFVGPVAGVNVSLPIFGDIVLSFGFPGINSIFGGSGDVLMAIGDAEPITPTVSFNFDYGTYTGLLLGVIGVLFGIVGWKNRGLLGAGSLLTLAGTVLVGLQGTFFDLVNENIIFELINSQFSSPLVEVNPSILAPGGIVCAVCFGICFLVLFIKTLITKSSKR